MDNLGRDNMAQGVRQAEIRPMLFDMEPIISLCRGFRRPDGSMRLLRVADLKDGVLTSNFSDETQWLTHLFCRESFVEEGFYGVWKWKAGPNKNDPNKIYIDSEYLPESHIIEIVLVSAHSPAELALRIRGGIEAFEPSFDTIFAFKNGSDYFATYCEARCLQMQNGRGSVKKQVYSLPLVRLTAEDIIRDAGHMFYKSVSPVYLEENLPLQDPTNTARDVILQRASWQYCKQKGLTKKEFQFVQEFLGEVPTDELTEEIAASCACSLQQTQAAVQKFSDNALQYLRGASQAGAVLAQTVQRTPELMQQIQKAIAGQWKQENAEKLQMAEKILQQLEQEKTGREQELSNAKKELDDLLAQIDRLTTETEKKQVLADAVEQEVADRIRAARENMARFIADLPYLSSESAPQSECESRAFVAGKRLPEAGLQECVTWQDAHDILTDELPEAGVIRELCGDFAAFLLAAYWRKQPLILAGPNGADIADALCATLFASTANRICCGESECIASQNTILEVKGGVTVLDSPFHTHWEQLLPMLSTNRETFWILTTPYTEDLLLQPKGIWNYAVVAATELLVDHPAPRQYVGGKLSQYFGFPQRKPSPFRWKGSEVLKGLPPTALRNLAGLSADFHQLAQSEKLDVELLTFGYILAFQTGRETMLESMISEKGRLISNQTNMLLRQMLGENI